MKFNLVNFLVSLNWTKEDLKKIITATIIMIIACFIFNNFLLIKIKIYQKRSWGDRIKIDIPDTVGVSGSIDIIQ